MIAHADNNDIPADVYESSKYVLLVKTGSVYNDHTSIRNNEHEEIQAELAKSPGLISKLGFLVVLCAR